MSGDGEARRRAAALLPALAPLGGRGWIVGGGLRDALMGRPVTDVDVALDGDAAAAARSLARAHGAGRFALSRAFGAWRVHGGALPFTVDVTPLQGGSLEEDLGRRDFTVNALALPLAGGDVVDLHGGLGDVEARRMRLVAPGAFRADPVRLLRLVRVSRQLGFAIDPQTAAQARADAALATGSAPERLMDELGRILGQHEAWRGVELLDDLRVLTALVPELERGRGMQQNPYHHRDVLGHILEVVRHCAEIAADPEPVFRGAAPRVAARLAEPLADEMTRGHALLLGALFHDVAKPATRAVTPEGRVTFFRHDELGARMADEWLRAMRTSTRLRETVVLLVRRHLPLGFLVHRAPLSLREIDRYLRLTEPAEVELIVLSVADRLATNGPRTTPSAISRHLALAREVLRVHFDLVDRGPVRSPLDGAGVAEAVGRPAGPWLRDALVALREEILVGRVRSRDDAVRFCRNWADRMLK
ncbi:MAG: HD domain-containing protein [Actinomycetota bacterium]